VRQAVQNLLHFPVIAALIDEADLAALAQVEEPGTEVLRELLRDLQAQPAASTAQVLERWRDHPAGERLARLAATDSITPHESAAGDELRNALRRLAQGAATAELDALIAKEQASGLDAAERARLLQLLQESRQKHRD
jgi:DNA primase